MHIRFTARGAPGLRGTAVLAVTALALSAAASASASTAALERAPPDESCARNATCPRWRLVVRATAGEANDVDLLAVGDAILVRDVAIKPGDSCQATPQGDVRCPRPDGGIEVLLGDGPDRVQAPALTGVYRGGPGDDLIAAAGTLIGDAGADTLFASTASTRLAGGSGDDRLVGPATHPDCGGGRDVFEPRRTAVLTTPHHRCEGIAAREEGFELAITRLRLAHGRVLLRLRGTRSTPVTVRVTVLAAASRRRLATARLSVGPNGVVHALPVDGLSDRRVLVTARAGGQTVGFAGVLDAGPRDRRQHVVARAVVRSHVSTSMSSMSSTGSRVDASSARTTARAAPATPPDGTGHISITAW